MPEKLSAVFQAINNNDAEEALGLLANLDINAWDTRPTFPRNPLMHALCRRQWDLAERLIEHGADVDATVAPDGDNLLILSMMFLDEEDVYRAIEFLLSHDANPNLLDRDGTSTFIRALESPSCTEDIITLFVEYGANVVAVDSRGRMPIEVARAENVRNLLRQQVLVGALEADAPIPIGPLFPRSDAIATPASDFSLSEFLVDSLQEFWLTFIMKMSEAEARARVYEKRGRIVEAGELLARVGRYGQAGRLLVRNSRKKRHYFEPAAPYFLRAKLMSDAVDALARHWLAGADLMKVDLRELRRKELLLDFLARVRTFRTEELIGLLRRAGEYRLAGDLYLCLAMRNYPETEEAERPTYLEKARWSYEKAELPPARLTQLYVLIEEERARRERAPATEKDTLRALCETGCLGRFLAVAKRLGSVFVTHYVDCLEDLLEFENWRGPLCERKEVARWIEHLRDYARRHGFSASAISELQPRQLEK